MKTLHATVISPAPLVADPGRRCVCTAVLGVVASVSFAGCSGMFSKPPPAPVLPPPAALPAPAKPAPPLPAALSIGVAASATINPTAGNRPSPVVVRVYELKASALFEAADFLALYEREQTVLGGDVIARDEFSIAPGEIKSLSKPLSAETKFVGVIAAFRDLERARWRAVVAVQPNKSNAILVHLDGIAVRAAASAT